MALALSRNTVGMMVPEGARMIEAHRVPTGITDATPARRYDRLARSREHRSILVEYRDLLDFLGVADPFGIIDAHDHAAELRRQARTRRPGTDRTSAAPGTVKGLADGTLDPDDITVDDTDPDRVRRELRAQRDALDAAADDAMHAVHQALRAAGDRIITDLLRPVIDQALANHRDRNEAERWDKVHAFAKKLRINRVVPVATDAPEPAYRYGRPDLAHVAAIVAAPDARIVDVIVTKEADARQRGEVMVFRVPKPSHPFGLYEAGEHPEWEPGLYTAAEVLDHHRQPVTVP